MSEYERITTMRLVVILLFIALVKANAQAPLHQQEQENHNLNPINDAAAKEEAEKLQNKRTLFGPTHYIPKHVGIHPLGFKYILGYGPISGYYPARPMSAWNSVRQTTVWKPNVPVFRQKPHVHIHPTQPVQPVLPVQPVVPIHPPEPAVVPVVKLAPEPVVPVVKPVVHLQSPVYQFYKALSNPLIPQPNIIQPPVVQPFVSQPHVVHPVQQPVFHQVQQFLPSPPVVQHVIPQAHVHPVQQFIAQPHLHPVQPLIPQHHLHPVQPLIPQPHLHPVQPLIPQHHLRPVQPLIPQPHLHPVQPLIPQPHLHQVHPVQPFVPQPNFVHHVPQPNYVHYIPQPTPAVPVAPAVSQLPLPLYNILKTFPNIFKHITPLYPVNPQPAAHPIPSDGGISVQIPQHLPEHPHFPPTQYPFQPEAGSGHEVHHQSQPEQPNFPPSQFPFHPEAGSDHEVHHQPQPDFHTEGHGQAENPFLIPQPQPQPQGPVHPHPQTPLYLPPHPVFRPGVANPVGPIEPTNSVHTEYSATYPKHPLVPALHPSITLEPPYGPGGTGLNINKH